MCASARARVRMCVCVCPYVCASVRRQRASVRLASQRHIAGQKRTVKKDRSSRSQPDTSSDTNEAFAACADSAVICCPRPMSRGTLTWEGARASPPPAGSRSPASAAAACASAAPCSSSCGQRGQGRPVSRAHGSVGVPRAQVPRGRFCFAYPSLLVSLPEATCVGRRAPRARHRARQAQLCRRQMHQHQPESVCIHLAHRPLEYWPCTSVYHTPGKEVYFSEVAAWRTGRRRSQQRAGGRSSSTITHTWTPAAQILRCVRRHRHPPGVHWQAVWRGL